MIFVVSLNEEKVVIVVEIATNKRHVIAAFSIEVI
jgi:hypothetical protein